MKKREEEKNVYNAILHVHERKNEMYDLIAMYNIAMLNFRKKHSES